MKKCTIAVAIAIAIAASGVTSFANADYSTDISANTMLINANRSSIADVNVKADDNKTGIDANTMLIGANRSSIADVNVKAEENKAGIQANAKQIQDNYENTINAVDSNTRRTEVNAKAIKR